MSMEAVTWEDLARFRQGLYRLFSVALLAPVPDRLDALRAAGEVLDDAGLDAFTFSTPLQAWRDTIAGPLSDAELDELSGEYIRLFVAGLDSSLCSPLESDYLTTAVGETGTITAQLAREYGRLGLRPAMWLGADHVATQLEVMAVLCEREGEARGDRVTEGRIGPEQSRPGGSTSGGRRSEASRALVVSALRDERTFLRRHLGRWHAAFAARVERATVVPFYRELARASHAFVHHDRELLECLSRMERGAA